MLLQPADLIIPDWPAPARVRAACTTRAGGVSAGPYARLNLGAHVDDDPAAVAENRARLQASLDLPAEPHWLNQVHGVQVVRADTSGAVVTADASYSDAPGAVCAVLTADCLPLLFCDRAATRVAAAHAGWKGLAAGVIEATLAALAIDPVDTLVWLGPAIGPRAFEVGAEVRAQFIGFDPLAESCFRVHRPGHWLADIYALARQRLAARGVQAVYGGGLCTHTDRERFFSYRRDGVTGRMASLVWLAS